MKICISVSENDLARIDEKCGGNRSAYIINAALESEIVMPKVKSRSRGMVKRYNRDYMEEQKNNSNMTSEQLLNYGKMLTTKQASAVLGVTRATVLNMIHDGRLKHLQCGKTIRIPQGALLGLIK